MNTPAPARTLFILSLKTAAFAACGILRAGIYRWVYIYLIHISVSHFFVSPFHLFAFVRPVLGFLLTIFGARVKEITESPHIPCYLSSVFAPNVLSFVETLCPSAEGEREQTLSWRTRNQLNSLTILRFSQFAVRWPIKCQFIYFLTVKHIFTDEPCVQYPTVYRLWTQRCINISNRAKSTTKLIDWDCMHLAVFARAPILCLNKFDNFPFVY